MSPVRKYFATKWPPFEFYFDGFKTNHTLWSQSVYVKDYTEGKELFVDCKLWDTPNTVKQVVQKIVDKGATMTTICLSLIHI